MQIIYKYKDQKKATIKRDKWRQMQWVCKRTAQRYLCKSAKYKSHIWFVCTARHHSLRGFHNSCIMKQQMKLCSCVYAVLILWFCALALNVLTVLTNIFHNGPYKQIWLEPAEWRFCLQQRESGINPITISPLRLASPPLMCYFLGWRSRQSSSHNYTDGSFGFASSC